LAVRWDERRLNAYIDYVNSIKASVNIVVLVLAEKGVVKANRGLPETEGLAMLSDAEGERSLKFDNVLILGDSATIVAARELTKHMWRMHSFARGELPVNTEIWHEAFSSYRLARTEFYNAARKSMGVPIAEIHSRSTWLEYADELQRRSEDPPSSSTTTSV
jgi:hypothetical protein